MFMALSDDFSDELRISLVTTCAKTHAIGFSAASKEYHAWCLRSLVCILGLLAKRIKGARSAPVDSSIYIYIYIGGYIGGPFSRPRAPRLEISQKGPGVKIAFLRSRFLRLFQRALGGLSGQFEVSF